MGAEPIWPAREGGFAVVKDYLLSSLHLARLSPGDRVPSVRRLAQLTGLDRKTVHRAYLRLAGEGFLVARAGSGTFLAEPGPGAGLHDGGRPVRLLQVVETALAQASALGVGDRQFARVVALMAHGGLAASTLAVAECNHEQIGLIAREVRDAVGAQVRGLALGEGAGAVATALAGVTGVVTTDCHRDEVLALAAPRGLPVYRVALDEGLPHSLLRRARFGPVVLVVRDRRYAPSFRKLLAQLRVPPETAERFQVVEASEAGAAMAAAGAAGAVYVSPLIDGTPLPRVAGWKRIPPQPYLDARSLAQLRIQVVADAVLREPEPIAARAH